MATQMWIAVNHETGYQIGRVLWAQNSNTHRYLREYTELKSNSVRFQKLLMEC